MAELRFYDSHCHLLNMAERDAILIELTKSAFATGQLTNAIDVATSSYDLDRRLALMKACGFSWYSLGLYPSHAAAPDWFGAVAHLEQQILQRPPDGPQLVAIGEIGLDCHWNYAPIETQLELCQAQIILANRFGLPVIIHNRQADQALLDLIQSCPPQRGGILHCFSSDLSFAVKMLDFGFKISFAGNTTYKNSNLLHEVARELPASAILVETDSPYLSPLPFRGQPNHPGNIRHICEFLAVLRNQPLPELCQQIECNVFEILSI